MTARNEAALEFLLSRRSRPAKTLVGPYPDRAELMTILTAGARCPDHGKLEPWRFIVLGAAALDRLARLAETRGEALGLDPEQVEKGRAQYRDSGCAIVVVASPRQSEKIPSIEQVYSAGAACLSVLNAALASGWGANWLSGWASHDRAFMRDGLGLETHEAIAGIIHIGTERVAPPERPRPDLDQIVKWVDE